MWITMGGKNYTQYVNHDVSIDAAVSDPLSKASFTLDDIQAQFAFNNFEEVIIWDENAPPNASLLNPLASPLVPAINMQVSTAYSSSQTMDGTPLTIGNGYVYVAMNNNSAGVAYGWQQIQAGYIVPGQQYMLSCYLACPQPLTNAIAFLQIIWQDISYNSLGVVYQSWGTVYPQQQVSISGTAPAGAAFATIQLGAQTTVAGNNSGLVQWTSPQMEPMWFTAQGVNYPSPDNNYAQVNSVQLPDGTYSRKCRIFTGYIDDIQSSYVGNQRYWTIDVVAASKILETTNLLNASYTGYYDDQILSDLITNNYSGIISIGQQNIALPPSTIVRGVLVDSITFTDNTLREVVNALSDLSGFIFYVDPYYYLHYVPSYFDISVTQLSDNPDYSTTFPYEDYSVEQDGTTMGNRVKVIGNKQNATAVDDTFSGDGTTTIFDLTSPPYTVQSITVGGVKQRAGVYGVDTFTTGRYSYTALVNKQQQYIVFKTAPAAGTNNIVVEYTYEDAVVAQVSSPDSYAKYRRWFDRKINDSNLTSTTAAKNRGLAELTKYAFERTILNVTTNNLYIPVGSIVLFTSQHDGYNQQPFTVQTVKTLHQGGGVYLYQYTAGAYNPTLVDHLRNTQKSLNRSNTTSNVQLIVTIDLALFDTIVYSETLKATSGPTNPQYLYSASPPGYTPTVLADSPLALYRLGESSGTNAIDASGNGRTGTYSGSGVAYGKAGSVVNEASTAVVLDGAAGTISLPSALNPGGLAAFAVEAWLYLSSTTFASQPTIAGNSVPYSSNQGYSFWLDSNAAGVHFVVGNGTTYAEAHSTSALLASQWYHLVGVYTGSAVTLYVNGVQAATAALTGTVGTSGYAPVIGHNPAGSSDYLPATIDNVAFYGAALSAARIMAHYVASAETLYAATVLYDSPQAYYRLGEYAKLNAIDASGNSYTGTYTASGVTYSEPGAPIGDSNTSVLFDGATGSVACPAGLSTTGWTAFTLEAWMKLSNASFASGVAIAANDQVSANKDGFAFNIGALAGNILFSIGCGTVKGALNAAYSFSAGVWYHIVGTWNGTTMTAYVNGVNIGTLSLSGTIAAATNNVALGYNPAQNGNFFPGALDEVAIYNTALSSARVLAHYQKGANAPARYGFASYYSYNYGSAVYGSATY